MILHQYENNISLLEKMYVDRYKRQHINFISFGIVEIV